jgi:hypothetical protein
MMTGADFDASTELIEKERKRLLELNEEILLRNRLGEGTVKMYIISLLKILRNAL